MNIRTVTLIFAAVFVIIGLLGFIPAATPGGLLFGVFAVDMIHNLVHLISGMVLAVVGAGIAGVGKERVVFQILGAVYALVALVGLIQGYTVAGLFGVNMADNVLHIVIALAALATGFLTKPSATASPAAPVSGTTGTM